MCDRGHTQRHSAGNSDAATYERARRLANLSMWTVALQRRRLNTDEPEDREFIFRKWTDFQFLIVALTRLRRATILAAKVPALTGAMQHALTNFDAALPMLKSMRDVAEHLDDYAIDKGRDVSISRESLEVGVVGDSLFQWLGHELNADTALSAAQQLFRDIQQAQSLVAARRTHRIMKARKSRLKITELARRIAGFSSPVVGESWKAPAADRSAVRTFLTFLEDRRVLFNPFHVEVEYQVQQSILQIREHCTKAIEALADSSLAIAPLKGIRAVCRRFLDEPLVHSRRFHQRDFYGPESPEFFTALGEFRATVGVHVVSLAVLYKIELDSDLASIVPAQDMEN